MRNHHCPFIMPKEALFLGEGWRWGGTLEIHEPTHSIDENVFRQTLSSSNQKNKVKKASNWSCRMQVMPSIKKTLYIYLNININMHLCNA